MESACLVEQPDKFFFCGMSSNRKTSTMNQYETPERTQCKMLWEVNTGKAKRTTCLKNLLSNPKLIQIKQCGGRNADGVGGSGKTLALGAPPLKSWLSSERVTVTVPFT